MKNFSGVVFNIIFRFPQKKIPDFFLLNIENFPYLLWVESYNSKHEQILIQNFEDLGADEHDMVEESPKIEISKSQQNHAYKCGND